MEYVEKPRCQPALQVDVSTFTLGRPSFEREVVENYTVVPHAPRQNITKRHVSFLYEHVSNCTCIYS